MCGKQKTFSATNLSELVKKIMSAQFLPLPDGYSEQLKHLLRVLLQINPKDRPTASEVLKFYIPLVYKNLGKFEGYAYNVGEDELGNTMKSSNVFGPSSSREYLEASTATMNDYVLNERSVLYQMKSFGNNFSLDPIQLPSTCKIKHVSTSGSHFIVVNDGEFDEMHVFLNFKFRWNF
jgi:NIMA (never in mitosis gene a)-related kinase 8